MNVKPPETLITVDQASLLAQVHPETIRRGCRSGQIPHVKIGRVLRIKRDEWMSQIETTPTPSEPATSGSCGEATSPE